MVVSAVSPPVSRGGQRQAGQRSISPAGAVHWTRGKGGDQASGARGVRPERQVDVASGDRRLERQLAQLLQEMSALRQELGALRQENAELRRELASRDAVAGGEGARPKVARSRGDDGGEHLVEGAMLAVSCQGETVGEMTTDSPSHLSEPAKKRGFGSSEPPAPNA